MNELKDVLLKLIYSSFKNVYMMCYTDTIELKDKDTLFLLVSINLHSKKYSYYINFIKYINKYYEDDLNVFNAELQLLGFKSS